jgi:uncharacterized membrane protein YphA (DoxX/SURF4 family)
MNVAAIVLSILLSVEFAFTGVTKLFDTTTAQTNAAHLGISSRLSRMIGAAQLAAVVGLLVGLAFKPLAIVTAAAVCLLMVGAIGYHRKARDKPPALLPAALTGLAALALIPVTVVA